MAVTRIDTFRRGDLEFDVTDSGPLDGPVAILLHGFPADRRSWDAVIPLLTDAGIRSLAPDQRGYSPGATPTGRAAYRTPELTRDVFALIDASGADRVHVVGHDWGGFVCWSVALAAPGRVSGITVLSTPHPSALRRAMTSSDQALRSWYIAFVQLPVLPELLLRGRLTRLLVRSGLPVEVAGRYGRSMARAGRLRAALDWYRGAWLPRRRRRRQPASSSPAASRSSRVQVATTYVWGSNDFALGRRAAELTADYVDAPYRFVELDENHWLPERSPGRVAAEIIRSIDDGRRAAG